MFGDNSIIDFLRNTSSRYGINTINSIVPFGDHQTGSVPVAGGGAGFDICFAFNQTSISNFNSIPAVNRRSLFYGYVTVSMGIIGALAAGPPLLTPYFGLTNPGGADQVQYLLGLNSLAGITISPTANQLLTYVLPAPVLFNYFDISVNINGATCQIYSTFNLVGWRVN